MTEYYVYALLDTRKPGPFKWGPYTFEYEPFYIGKGKQGRLNAHFKGAYAKEGKRYNSLKCTIIRNIKRKTKTLPKSIKIVENLEETGAYDLEIKLIALIGRRDYDEGPLANATDGGEGAIGLTFTEEWCRMQGAINRETWKNPKVREARIAGIKRTVRLKTSKELSQQTDLARQKLGFLRKADATFQDWVTKQIQLGLSNRTDEEKEAQYLNASRTWHSKTKQEQQAIADKESETKRNWSQAKKKRVSANCRNGQLEYRANASPEELAKHAKASQKGVQDFYDNRTDDQVEAKREAHRQAHVAMSAKEKRTLSDAISIGKQNSDKKEIDGAKKSCSLSVFNKLLEDGIITEEQANVERPIVIRAIEKYYTRPDFEPRTPVEWSDNLRKRLILKYGSEKLKKAISKMKVTEIKAYLTSLRYGPKVKKPVDPLVKHIATTYTAIGRLLDQLQIDGILTPTLTLKLEPLLKCEADSIELDTSASDYCLALRKRLVLKYASKGIKRKLAAGKFETPTQIKNWMDRVRNLYCKHSSVNITQYCK